MVVQQSMFDDVVRPHGFRYIDNFINVSEEQELLKAIRRLRWEEIKMHGVVAKRKVFHFGMDYEYHTRKLTRTTPAPEFLQFLLSKTAIALNVQIEDLAEILISHYPIGAPIGWHRDAPQFEALLGVSLGSPCLLKMRQITPDETLGYKHILDQRSAYILQGDARWKWQHHIPPVKEERFSITFRTLTEKFQSNNASV